MSGVDFLLERPVALPELRDALAAALGVSDVEVVEDVAALEGSRPAHAVVSATGGEFRALVSLDPLGDLDTVRAMAGALGMRVITPDQEAANPYAMVLVHPDGRQERVALQAEPFDERDEYRLQETR